MKLGCVALEGHTRAFTPRLAGAEAIDLYKGPFARQGRGEAELARHLVVDLEQQLAAAGVPDDGDSVGVTENTMPPRPVGRCPCPGPGPRRDGNAATRRLHGASLTPSRGCAAASRSGTEPSRSPPILCGGKSSLSSPPPPLSPPPWARGRGNTSQRRLRRRRGRRVGGGRACVASANHCCINSCDRQFQHADGPCRRVSGSKDDLSVDRPACTLRSTLAPSHRSKCTPYGEAT